MSSSVVKLKITKLFIKDLAGAIDRIKTSSTLQKPKYLQKGLERLESMLKLLERETDRKDAQYQRLAEVLEQTKAELVAPDTLSHGPMSTDLEVLHNMKCNVGNLSRALKEALSARNFHMDHAKELIDELSQVREELGKEQADHFASTAEAAHYKALIGTMHDLLWEGRVEIVNLTTRCETAEEAVATMSEGPGYHQCKVCFAGESNAFFACGHLACCMACAHQLPAVQDGSDTVRCPMCRKEGGYQKVFFG